MFYIADLFDAQAEVLADFDSFADADGLVVDQQFQRLFAAFDEFDDRADAEPHDFGQKQLSLGQFDDHGHLKSEDALKFPLR